MLLSDIIEVTSGNLNSGLSYIDDSFSKIGMYDESFLVNGTYLPIPKIKNKTEFDNFFICSATQDAQFVVKSSCILNYMIIGGGGAGKYVNSNPSCSGSGGGAGGAIKGNVTVNSGDVCTVKIGKGGNALSNSVGSSTVLTLSNSTGGIKGTATAGAGANGYSQGSSSSAQCPGGTGGICSSTGFLSEVEMISGQPGGFAYYYHGQNGGYGLAGGYPNLNNVEIFQQPSLLINDIIYWLPGGGGGGSGEPYSSQNPLINYNVYSSLYSGCPGVSNYGGGFGNGIGNTNNYMDAWFFGAGGGGGCQNGGSGGNINTAGNGYSGVAIFWVSKVQNKTILTDIINEIMDTAQYYSIETKGYITGTLQTMFFNPYLGYALDKSSLYQVIQVDNLADFNIVDISTNQNFDNKLSTTSFQAVYKNTIKIVCSDDSILFIEGVTLSGTCRLIISSILPKNGRNTKLLSYKFPELGTQYFNYLDYKNCVFTSSKSYTQKSNGDVIDFDLNLIIPNLFDRCSDLISRTINRYIYQVN